MYTCTANICCNLSINEHFIRVVEIISHECMNVRRPELQENENV